jgi:hypothetical protein
VQLGKAIMSGMHIRDLDPKSLSAHLATRGVSPVGTQSVRGMTINAFQVMALLYVILPYACYGMVWNFIPCDTVKQVRVFRFILLCKSSNVV